MNIFNGKTKIMARVARFWKKNFQYLPQIHIFSQRISKSHRKFLNFRVALWTFLWDFDFSQKISQSFTEVWSFHRDFVNFSVRKKKVTEFLWDYVKNEEKIKKVRAMIDLFFKKWYDLRESPLLVFWYT